MSWQTPITNRTDQSYYDFTDLNRVDNNTQYLRDYIDDNLGTNIILPYSFVTATISTLPRVGIINGLEQNINTLKNYLGYSPVGWADLFEAWQGNTYDFIFTNMNDLEENLVLIKADLEERVSSIIFVGEPLAITGAIPPRIGGI